MPRSPWPPTSRFHADRLAAPHKRLRASSDPTGCWEGAGLAERIGRYHSATRVGGRLISAVVTSRRRTRGASPRVSSYRLGLSVTWPFVKLITQAGDPSAMRKWWV